MKYLTSSHSFLEVDLEFIEVVLRSLIHKLLSLRHHPLILLDFCSLKVVQLSGKGCVASLARLMRCALLKGMGLIRIVGTPEPVMTLQLSLVHHL